MQFIQDEKMHGVENMCKEVIKNSETYCQQRTDIFEDYQRVQQELQEARETIFRLTGDYNYKSGEIYTGSEQEIPILQTQHEDPQAQQIRSTFNAHNQPTLRDSMDSAGGCRIFCMPNKKKD